MSLLRLEFETHMRYTRICKLNSNAMARGTVKEQVRHENP